MPGNQRYSCHSSRAQARAKQAHTDWTPASILPPARPSGPDEDRFIDFVYETQVFKLNPEADQDGKKLRQISEFSDGLLPRAQS
jgi:hypothetical protein